MSIDPQSADAGPGQKRHAGDPLQMTEAEKRAAEWEARHDVAARGRRPGAETVQHYFAHERLVHAAEPHAAGAHAATRAPEQPGQPVQPAQATPPPRQPQRRGVLWRLLHRGDRPHPA